MSVECLDGGVHIFSCIDGMKINMVKYSPF